MTYDTSGESTEPDMFVESSYPLGYVVSISSRAVGVAKFVPSVDTKSQGALAVDFQTENSGSDPVMKDTREIIDISEDYNPSDDDFIDSNRRLKKVPDRCGNKKTVLLKRIPSTTSSGESRMHLLRRPKVLDLW